MRRRILLRRRRLKCVTFRVRSAGAGVSCPPSIIFLMCIGRISCVTWLTSSLFNLFAPLFLLEASVVRDTTGATFATPPAPSRSTTTLTAAACTATLPTTLWRWATAAHCRTASLPPWWIRRRFRGGRSRFDQLIEFVVAPDEIIVVVVVVVATPIVLTCACRP